MNEKGESEPLLGISSAVTVRTLLLLMKSLTAEKRQILNYMDSMHTYIITLIQPSGALIWPIWMPVSVS